MKDKRKKEFQYTSHASEEYAKRRGWSTNKIEDTILNAEKLSLSRGVDPPHKLAVVYHSPENPNQYVVRSTDGELLELSDRNDRHWGPGNWKSKYLYLGKHEKRKRKISGRHKNDK